MSNQNLQQYKPLYIQTARDYLNSLQKNITLLLQHPANIDALKQAHIDAHSLKSQSLMMQYNNIATFSGTIEKTLAETIEKQLPLNTELLHHIQQGTEKMLQSLEEIENHDQDLDMTQEIEKLMSFW